MMTISATQNGVTSVALSTDLVTALTSLGVQASGFGSTRIRNGVARFGITGGAVELNRTRVEIAHSLYCRTGSGYGSSRCIRSIIPNFGSR